MSGAPARSAAGSPMRSTKLAARVAPLQPLVDALLASDRFGAPVGDALLRLAAEQRTALRRRAEARARTVPVRLLFPLVFLVLPAFGLLTVVPAVLAGIGAPVTRPASIRTKGRLHGTTRPPRHGCRDETGQTTAEYALVILGAAAIATLLIAWAKGSGAIGDLFDEVIEQDPVVAGARRSERGQATVEFALVLPVLVFAARRDPPGRARRPRLRRGRARGTRGCPSRERRRRSRAEPRTACSPGAACHVGARPEGRRADRGRRRVHVGHRPAARRRAVPRPAAAPPGDHAGREVRRGCERGAATIVMVAVLALGLLLALAAARAGAAAVAGARADSAADAAALAGADMLALRGDRAPRSRRLGRRPPRTAPSCSAAPATVAS